MFNRLKRIFPLVLIFVFALTAMAFAEIGNKRSGIYHRDYCSHVSRMNESNKVYFNSKADADASGYRPCNLY